MAASPPLVGLSASECPVCYEQLGTQRTPYSLTCGHTVCIVCIKRLSESKNTLTCSLCKEIVPVSGVKRNVTLLQLISQLHSEMSGSFTSSLSTPFETIEFGTMLDRGVSGEVHRGQWQGNDVAIKVFASGQLTDEAKESFRREVCIMNKLKHPNVVLLMAACPNPPRLAIVMEYVGGGSLYSHLYINKTVFTTEFTAQILANITRGLQYLHSINILHRDLKSKNVLLTGAPPHCQAKLCDFGLARMRLENATMTGNIGTIHWTAPEVLNCSRYHFSADIYSLGMVIYEMISGSIPFSKLLPPAVIVAVLLRRERPQPPLDTHCIFAALYNKCTTWEPADRPSILSILRDVQPLLSSHSPSEHTDTLNISWDDSLGDQTILGIDLDDDDDYELMQFLLGQSGSDEEDNAVGVELVDDDIKPKLMPTSSAERDIMAPDSIYEDTRGVLSSEELKTYHSYHRNLMFSSNINSSAHDRLHMNVPLIPANGIAPQRNNLQHSMSYEQEQQPREEDEISFRDRANTMNEGILNTAYYDVDTEIATKLQREEKQQQIMNDYKLASDLQWNYRDNLVGTIAPAPPPPPLPTQLPLQHLPYRLTPQQLLLSQLKRPYLKRRLKPVKTIEKRAYRIGRVVDGTNSELSNFTLQKELAAFNKQWLQKVQLKEPKPPFPVGKVVIPERNFVRSIVHRMNSLVQSEIKDYNRMVLRPVDTEVKGKLPTVDDIEKEKNPPSPPPPPPPPPEVPPVTKASSLLSPFKKKTTKHHNSSKFAQNESLEMSYPVEFQEQTDEQPVTFTKKITSSPKKQGHVSKASMESFVITKSDNKYFKIKKSNKRK